MDSALNPSKGSYSVLSGKPSLHPPLPIGRGVCEVWSGINNNMDLSTLTPLIQERYGYNTGELNDSRNPLQKRRKSSCIPCFRIALSAVIATKRYRSALWSGLSPVRRVRHPPPTFRHGVLSPLRKPNIRIGPRRSVGIRNSSARHYPPLNRSADAIFYAVFWRSGVSLSVDNLNLLLQGTIA
jgi:hypothetical protein